MVRVERDFRGAQVAVIATAPCLDVFLIFKLDMSGVCAADIEVSRPMEKE